jgi:YegS/Rv2252/BmrU family lipid kinase
MQAVAPSKFLFVLNPKSGSKSRTNWQSLISEYFKSKPHAIEFFLFTGNDDAGSLGQKIGEIKPDKVIAVGGDGTINLVATKLMGTNIPMGILPAGSANGLAREFQLPSSPDLNLELIETGIVREMDVLKINHEFISLHLADLGLNAQLIKYFEESNWRGKLGYAKVLLKTLWRTQRVRVTIETDKEKMERKAYMVVLANARTYGTGAVINPIGDLHDGKFEVIIVRKLAFSVLLKMIFRHKPYNSEKIEIYSTTKVTIRSNRKTYFQADGEYLGRKNLIQAEIVTGKLKIIKPAEDTELSLEKQAIRHNFLSNT